MGSLSLIRSDRKVNSSFNLLQSTGPLVLANFIYWEAEFFFVQPFHNIKIVSAIIFQISELSSLEDSAL